MKGLGLTSMFRDRHGFMPTQLKTKQKQNTFALLFYNIKGPELKTYRKRKGQKCSNFFYYIKLLIWTLLLIWVLPIHETVKTQ